MAGTFPTLEQLRQDLEQLGEIIETKAPHLGDSEEERAQFREHLETARQRLDTASNDFERLLVFPYLLTAACDGHASLQIPDELITSSSPVQLRSAPFGLVVTGNRLVLSSTHGGVEIGDELLTINGLDASEVLAQACELVSPPHPQVRRSWALRWFWSLVVARLIPSQTNWEITARKLDGSQTELSLPMDSAEEAPRRFPPVALTVHGNVACIKIPSFGWPDGVWPFLHENMPDFKAKASEFLLGLLDEASQYPAFIIDLRGNEGGVDHVMSMILQYLIPGEFLLYSLQRRVKGVAGEWNKPGYWNVGGDEATPMFPARSTPVPYAGKVAVIMDEGCASATSIMLLALRHHRPDIPFIGRGTSATVGDSAMLGTLTHSQIEVTMSTLRGFSPDGKLIEGYIIEPDVPVEWSPQDIAAKADPDMEAALRLLILQKD